MEFLCPVAPGAALGWAHVAHLGLLGVVAGIGFPLVGRGLVAFRRSPPAAAGASSAAGSSPAVTRDCDADSMAVPPVQVVSSHRGQHPRRRP